MPPATGVGETVDYEPSGGDLGSVSYLTSLCGSCLCGSGRGAYADTAGDQAHLLAARPWPVSWAEGRR